MKKILEGDVTSPFIIYLTFESDSFIAFKVECFMIFKIVQPDIATIILSTNIVAKIVQPDIATIILSSSNST